LSASRVPVGGRLIATDTDGAWTRIDQSAQLVADDLGIEISPQVLADPTIRRRIATALPPWRRT